MREWNFRVLSYNDDFLVAPSRGRAATVEDSDDVVDRIECLMGGLGPARYRKKGILGRGLTVVQEKVRRMLRFCSAKWRNTGTGSAADP